MLEYFALVTRALRFWTRIDLPILPFEIDPHAPPVMNELVPAVPVAGAVIGLAGAFVLLVGTGLGLPTLLTASFAVIALILVTGAMHEDGLADVADAFGGGRSIEHKLEIMKDPRLGSFGVTALVMILFVRVGALAALLDLLGVWRCAAVLIAAAALARIAGLWPLHALASARSEGAGAATGGLGFAPWRQGALIGAGIALVGGLLGVGFVLTALAFIVLSAAVWGMTRLADRHIGGYTGDVCGAATILAETAFLAATLIHIW